MANQPETKPETQPESLLVIELSSIATGYRVLEVVTRANQTKVIEASVVGENRFFILCSGSADQLNDAYQAVRSSFEAGGAEQIVDHAILDLTSQALLEALYSLPQVALAESLVVVETETISGMLVAGRALTTHHELQCIEIKISRSAKGAHGFFTGSSLHAAPAAEDARTHLKTAMREGSIEVIDRPNDAFRSYFNLTGQS